MKRDGPWKCQRRLKDKETPWLLCSRQRKAFPRAKVWVVGSCDSPGNKLTGIPSPALLVAASLRLSTPILQSTGLTRGPGWDSGCVCARAKEQLQGCDRRVGEVREGKSVKSDRDAPERGTRVER